MNTAAVRLGARESLLESEVGPPPAGYRRVVRNMPAGTWSRTAVLRAFRLWYREHGRPPTAYAWSPPSNGIRGRTEHAQTLLGSSYPSPTTVRRYFGSWSAALQESGLRTERFAPWDLSLADRVAVARRLSAGGLRPKEIARELGVTATTVRKYLHAGTCPVCGGPLVTSTASRCHDCDARARGASWSVAEAEAAVRAWTADRAAVIAALRELGATQGRRPRWSDLHPKRDGFPSYGKTVRLFGSFGAALESAGFRSRGRRWTRAEVVFALRSWSQLHGRPPVYVDWNLATNEHPGSRAVTELFGGWSAALVAARLRTNWDRERIVESLLTWTAEHGHAPTVRDWQSPDSSGRRPTTQRVRTTFGAWSLAIAAAGLAGDSGRGKRWRWD